MPLHHINIDEEEEEALEVSVKTLDWNLQQDVWKTSLCLNCTFNCSELWRYSSFHFPGRGEPLTLFICATFTPARPFFSLPPRGNITAVVLSFTKALNWCQSGNCHFIKSRLPCLAAQPRAPARGGEERLLSDNRVKATSEGRIGYLLSLCLGSDAYEHISSL